MGNSRKISREDIEFLKSVYRNSQKYRFFVQLFGRGILPMEELWGLKMGESSELVEAFERFFDERSVDLYAPLLDNLTESSRRVLCAVRKGTDAERYLYRYIYSRRKNGKRVKTEQLLKVLAAGGYPVRGNEAKYAKLIKRVRVKVYRDLRKEKEALYETIDV